MERRERKQLLLATDVPMTMEKFLQLHSDGRELVFEAYNQVPELVATADAMEDFKNAAYAERNRLLAGFVALSIKLGFKVWRAKHQDPDWEDDWRSIIFIDLPTGQVAWHIHDSELSMFELLPDGDNNWDGHDTEEKYQRVINLRNWIWK